MLCDVMQSKEWLSVAPAQSSMWFPLIVEITCRMNCSQMWASLGFCGQHGSHLCNVSGLLSAWSRPVNKSEAMLAFSRRFSDTLFPHDGRINQSQGFVGWIISRFWFWRLVDDAQEGSYYNDNNNNITSPRAGRGCHRTTTDMAQKSTCVRDGAMSRFHQTYQLWWQITL